MPGRGWLSRRILRSTWPAREWLSMWQFTRRMLITTTATIMSTCSSPCGKLDRMDLATKCANGTQPSSSIAGRKSGRNSARSILSARDFIRRPSVSEWGIYHGRKGRATRISDINREIEERNRLRGVPREIREAYALSSDPHAFAQTLEQKNMMLARITKDDARNYATEFAITDKYVPQYREGEYAIATEQGAVYRLTRMTTGDSYKGVSDFTKPLNQQDYPSLEAALGERMKRSLIPNGGQS